MTAPGNHPEAVGRRWCFIFDLDGTICDVSHRRHLALSRNWSAFYAGMGDDTPHDHIVTVLMALHNLNFPIILTTGRPDIYRRLTELWLTLHQIPHTLLLMRDRYDKRDDSVVKAEMLGNIRAHGLEPLMAFDDRDRVVKMWRDNNIPCAQVAEGDF